MHCPIYTQAKQVEINKCGVTLLMHPGFPVQKYNFGFLKNNYTFIVWQRKNH